LVRRNNVAYCAARRIEMNLKPAKKTADYAFG
jgi:hypothetical protein